MSTVRATHPDYSSRAMPDLAAGLAVGPIVALITLRILSSWNWLNGAFFGADQKVSSAFLSGNFLVTRIGGAHGFAASSLYPGIGHFIASGVASNAAFWAWVIFLGEAVAGISFLFGIFTRLGGLSAAFSALANLLAAGGNGADNIGQNYLLLVLGITFLVVGAGRWFGVDGWLQKRYPDSKWLKILG